MTLRMEYWKIAPEELKALLALQQKSKAGLDAVLFELVCLRISQINGCSFCVDMHSSQARRLDVNDRHLAGLSTWRRTPFFSPAERAALDWAERLTEVTDGVPLDTPFASLREHFSDAQVVALTFSVAVMNAMNRIAIGFAREPL